MCMKRVQILLPDAMFAELKRRATAREQTVTEVIRRGVERELEAMGEDLREPVLHVYDLGVPPVPVADWREIANDRGA